MKQWLYPQSSNGGPGNAGARTMNSGPSGKEQPPLSRRLALAWDVARGMAYLESRGVMHRDLKPQNLLLSAANEGAKPPLRIACRRFHSARSVSHSTPLATRKSAWFSRSSAPGSAVPSSSAAAAPSRRITPHTRALSEHGACIIDTAADGAWVGSCMNTGHYCCGTERIYVVREVYDEFLQKVLEKGKALRQGSQHGWDEDIARSAGGARDPTAAKCVIDANGESGIFEVYGPARLDLWDLSLTNGDVAGFANDADADAEAKTRKRFVVCRYGPRCDRAHPSDAEVRGNIEDWYVTRSLFRRSSGAEKKTDEKDFLGADGASGSTVATPNATPARIFSKKPTWSVLGSGLFDFRARHAAPRAARTSADEQPRVTVTNYSYESTSARVRRRLAKKAESGSRYVSEFVNERFFDAILDGDPAFARVLSHKSAHKEITEAYGARRKIFETLRGLGWDGEYGKKNETPV